MDKLKLISYGLVVLGIILFIGGITLSFNTLVEYGIYAGVAGFIGYVIVLLMGSTSKTIQKPN